MTAASEIATRIRAALNFAADRSDDGVWSNFTPEIRTQKLAAETVEFIDARSLNPPASLEREGFQLHRHPFEGADWHSQEWLDRIYVPRSIEFVREVTGAPLVAPFFHGQTLIRHSGDSEFPPAADFVHFDQSRASVQHFIELAADDAARRRYPVVQLINLWRVLTPPPQDVPLAICDQRSIDERDWVFGRTVEPQIPEGVPYTTSVHNPEQRWHFYSDVTPEDVIVFKQFDSRPDRPMGCLHGAFRYPRELPGSVPRVSIELRIFAFSEA